MARVALLLVPVEYHEAMPGRDSSTSTPGVVVPLLDGIPETRLVQIPRVAEQRRIVGDLENHKVHICANVDRQPRRDVHAPPARPRPRRITSVCARGHRPVCGAGELEVELSVGVEVEVDARGVAEDRHPELDRGLDVSDERRVRGHVGVRGQLDVCAPKCGGRGGENERRQSGPGSEKCVLRDKWIRTGVSWGKYAARGRRRRRGVHELAARDRVREVDVHHQGRVEGRIGLAVDGERGAELEDAPEVQPWQTDRVERDVPGRKAALENHANTGAVSAELVLSHWHVQRVLPGGRDSPRGQRSR